MTAALAAFAATDTSGTAQVDLSDGNVQVDTSTGNIQIFTTGLSETFLGDATAAFASIGLSASGTVVNSYIGVLAASLSSFGASSAGKQLFVGTGSAALQSFGLTGVGAAGSIFFGPMSAALQSFGASVSGAEAFVGTGLAAVAPFAAAATGTVVTSTTTVRVVVNYGFHGK